MSKFFSILSQALSILFYPLWMPTYGVVILCAAMSRSFELTPAYWLMAIGGTLFLTCVMPLLIILVMKSIGRVKDLMISDSRERTLPYLFSVVCMILWCVYLQHIMHMSFGVLTSAWSSVFILLIMTVINLRWKISIHMATFGCLMTGITAYMLENAIGGPEWCVLMIGLAWLLMCARVQLNAHTPAQVSLGLLVGIVVPMIPHIMIFRYLYA